MQKELVPQSKEKTKDSLLSWTQFADAGMEATRKLTAQVFNLQNFALMGKSAMETSADLRRTEEHVLNESLRTFIGMFPMEASASFVRDIGSVYTDAATRMTTQQMDLLQIYLNSVSNCFETLKKSRSTLDVMTAQMGFYTEIQQKTKDNVVGTLMISEGVKTAINAVVENTLDTMQGADVADKSK